MCRFVAYQGVPIVLDDLLFNPKHSLINQSINAKELEEPLNGDGFGIGWYVPELGSSPAVFVSMTPAWSNRNLRNLAPKIRSGAIMAHVRAASVGDISEANCHPFHYGDWMFMHNGGIEDFGLVKREVRRKLSDPVYSWLKGQTDSEHFFALVLDEILPKGANVQVSDVTKGIESALRYVTSLKKAAGVKDETYLNCCITNGRFMIATRCLLGSDEPPLSLYYSTGKRYVCEDGVCHMLPADSGSRAAIIASEKLTDMGDDWHEVPANHYVIVSQDAVAKTQPMKL